MLSANMVPSHQGQASVVFSTRHQDRTMRAHDYPLVETPDFLLAVLERASEAVVIADGDLRVSHFNAAAELIWELDRAQVLGCHVSRLGLQDLQQHHVANGDEAARGGNSRITIQRKDGSRIRAAVSLSRIEAGSQSHTIAFVRDVSTEVDLQEKLALLTLIADGTNRAVVVTDRRLKTLYTNGAFAEMFGYSLEEAKGRQANELLVGRHTDRRALARLRRVIDEEGDGEQEILSYDKNGDEVWISARVRAFRNDRGRLKYVCALLADITETKQLRSLQQLIMNALADEIPITEIADQLCRRVEQIAPDVVSSLLHIDACGLIHPLGGPSLPEDYSGALDGVAIGADIGSCGSAAFFASRCWRWILTPIRAGSRSRPGRSSLACAPAGPRQSRPRTAA
jgi:PAS domain S-box-containing protein